MMSHRWSSPTKSASAGARPAHFATLRADRSITQDIQESRDRRASLGLQRANGRVSGATGAGETRGSAIACGGRFVKTLDWKISSLNVDSIASEATNRDRTVDAGA
jgi:hypothetical protein